MNLLDEKGTVANISSRVMLDAARRAGVDTPSILNELGIDSLQISNPSGRLKPEQVEAIWTECLRRSGDDLLALKCAVDVPPGTYAVVSHLVHASATVGDALRGITRYLDLINSYLSLELTEASDPVTLTMQHRLSQRRLSRHYTEYTFALIVGHLRQTAERDWTPIRVYFAYDPPATTELHERVFGCPVQFRSDRNRILIPRSALLIPQRHHDPDRFQATSRHAEEQLKRAAHPGRFIEDLRHVLSANLTQPETPLTLAARELGMSPRTLQRRLKEADLTFQEVLDELRCDLALDLLKRPDLTGADVAFLLGFAEPSAFYKAFKRWTGRTPLGLGEPQSQ